MQNYEEPVSYLWKKFWLFSKGNRIKVVSFLFLKVMSEVMSFFRPLVVAFLINTIQLEGISSANLGRLLLIAFFPVLLTLLFWLFHYPSRMLEMKNAFFVRSQYKKYLVEGVLNLPPKWHQENHSGDIMDKIQKGSGGLFDFSNELFEIVETVFHFFSSIIVLLFFNLFSGLLSLFFVIFAIMVIIRFDRVLRSYYKEMFSKENEISQKIYDFFSNITTVIVLRIKKIASSEIYKKIKAPFEIFVKSARSNEKKWMIVSLMSEFMIFSVLSAYILREAFSGGIVMIGTLFAIYEYVNRVAGIFFEFAHKYGIILFQKTSVENSELLAKDFKKARNARKIEMESWKKLQIKDLNFSYDLRHRKISLTDVNMTISPGERIAFVGESGSGKTTLLKILVGLFIPKRMEVWLSGRRGKTKLSGFEGISQNFSLIPQDSELFTATIRENLTLGVEYSESEIQEFMKIACFDKVVERLPRGLESHIKEKGVNLSGGEKQRLAIARGLIASRDKEIVMMDEPTSSVDSKNELEIYRNIFRKFRDKTIISSVHRLHMLKLFDKIYVFDNGRIVASGAFERLKQKSPEFRELLKKYAVKRKASR